MNKPKKWLLLAAIAGTIFVSDQVTKYLAVSRLTLLWDAMQVKTLGDKVHAFVTEKDVLERGLVAAPVHVLRSWWQHRYTQNRGAAWGFLSGAAEGFRVPFFHLVTIAALIFILSYYRKLSEGQRYLQVALALLLGGALGNGTDRILRGYVIDFIDWHWNDPLWLRPSLHWPTFNIADCGVSVGLVLLFLEMIFVKHPPEAAGAAGAKKPA